jgi:serine-type D-Ala-D-Ala carboxypeptidase (penicillin-binding protein 5/6)
MIKNFLPKGIVPYLISAGIVVVAIFMTTLIPLISAKTEDSLVSIQVLVPKVSSGAAGITKTNLPPLDGNSPIASYSARALLVKDLATDTVLYQKQADLRLPIASTTKIMTALVASEYFKPNSVLTVGASANTDGSRVGLIVGEKLDFRSLLYGMLLDSGNDAAFCIAENYPGGVPGFVAAMNQKATDLGLLNTHFDNPAGFDSNNHYSSASDLAKITAEALKNSDLSRVFATKETDIVSLDKKESYHLVNLNKLLTSLNGVLGVKTGSTPAAKENLVTLVERSGHRVLTVVLGSDDRFGETTELVDWTYTNFKWK